MLYHRLSLLCGYKTSYWNLHVTDSLEISYLLRLLQEYRPMSLRWRECCQRSPTSGSSERLWSRSRRPGRPCRRCSRVCRSCTSRPGRCFWNEWVNTWVNKPELMYYIDQGMTTASLFAFANYNKWKDAITSYSFQFWIFFRFEISVERWV